MSTPESGLDFTILDVPDTEFLDAPEPVAEAPEPEAPAPVERERDAVTLPSTIGRERRINPFLRCREPTVRGAAERHAGTTLDRPADVFAVIRSWKDGFR